ncbi:MAG: glutamate synthase subunit beta [Planctomycetota bacterium]|jgi:NAD(P)H-dependent glutamate synthase small subunit
MGDPRGFIKHERQGMSLESVDSRLEHHNEQYTPLSDDDISTQASRCMDCGIPFCMTGCPLGNLIPDWNDDVYRGKWDKAVSALLATNNFPEFTGRVCPAPCENACCLGVTKPAVSIKLHEYAITEKGFEQGLITAVVPEQRTGKTVAIVGGGPAGLACAQQLNRAGHTVTVFEKNDRAGGLVMYGIPHYKIRKETVQRRIDLLAKEGIQFRFNCEVGADITATELHEQFDAVVLSTGSEQPRDLPAPGRELDGIHFAMEFLPQQNRANWGDEDVAALHPDKRVISAAGKNVVVIGGGDTGSDCIGTSLRQGAINVENLELLPRPPAERGDGNPWPQYARVYRKSTSVAEMEEREGEVHYGTLTKEFLGENGKLTGIKIVDVAWEGRSFSEVEGSERVLPCELVLLAMGYLGPRQGLVEQFGLDTDARSNVLTNPINRMASVDGVFAAGDCRRGQSLVVWAIAEGREVARCVDEYLTGTESLLPAVKIDAFAY